MIDGRTWIYWNRQLHDGALKPWSLDPCEPEGVPLHAWDDEYGMEVSFVLERYPTRANGDVVDVWHPRQRPNREDVDYAVEQWHDMRARYDSELGRVWLDAEEERTGARPELFDCWRWAEAWRAEKRENGRVRFTAHMTAAEVASALNQELADQGLAGDMTYTVEDLVRAGEGVVRPRR